MYMYVYLHIVVRTQVLYPLPYLADGVKGLLKGVQQYAIQCAVWRGDPLCLSPLQCLPLWKEEQGIQEGRTRL